MNYIVKLIISVHSRTFFSIPKMKICSLFNYNSEKFYTTVSINFWKGNKNIHCKMVLQLKMVNNVIR